MTSDKDLIHKVSADLLRYIKQYHKQQVEQKKFHVQKDSVIVSRPVVTKKGKKVVNKEYVMKPIKIIMYPSEETSYVATDGTVITDFYELAEYQVFKEGWYPLIFKGYAEHEIRTKQNYYFVAGDVIEFFKGDELQ